MSKDSRMAAAARAVYDVLEGSISDQDARRQRKQWEQCLLISSAVLLAIDSMRQPAACPPTPTATLTPTGQAATPLSRKSLRARSEA